MHVFQIALRDELNVVNILICQLVFDCFVLKLSIAEFLWVSPAKTARFIISLFIFLVPEQLEFTLVQRFEILILIEIFVVFILLE